jgi:uncharacterized protein YdhG (YjbR/CyaY superfamily)
MQGVRTGRQSVKAFREELRDYETSKGTIRFQPERPLPAPLIRKLVQARIRQNQEKQRAASGSQKAALRRHSC